jgi:hypothetical protein
MASNLCFRIISCSDWRSFSSLSISSLFTLWNWIPKQRLTSIVPWKILILKKHDY